MSQRKKRNNQPKPASAPTPPQPQSPQPKIPEAAKVSFWKKIPLWNLINTVLGVGGILVGSISIHYYRQQSEAAKEANARASGRIGAEIALEDSVPNSKTLPIADRKRIFGSEYTTANVDLVRKLQDLRPKVVLRNIGKESIDTIRLSVKCKFTTGTKEAFNLIGMDPNREPISTESYFKEDYVLDRKLNPSEVVLVPLTKGLLSQMLEAQQGKDKNDERYGAFEIKVSGKVVGGTSFDGIVDDRVLIMRLLWVPKNYDEEVCRKLIDKMQLQAEVRKSDD